MLSDYLINEATKITKGLPISPNFLLDHVSTGAFHYTMSKWTPHFTVQLQSLLNKDIPLWQMAANLQLGAEGVLEPMLKQFGADLIVRSGLSPGNGGLSFDIQVSGFQGNMFNVMQDIQKIAKGADTIALVQGASSVARIAFNSQSVQNMLTKELPKMVSIDLATGLQIPGLAQIRGFI